MVIFWKNECIVLYEGRVFLSGKINTKNDLWDVPMAPTMVPRHVTRSHNVLHKVPQINNVFAMKSVQARVKYLHQCLYSTQISTLIATVNKNQLETWLRLTARAIRQYLADALATAKGHMKRPRQGVQSTSRIRVTRAQRDNIRVLTAKGHIKQPRNEYHQKVKCA